MNKALLSFVAAAVIAGGVLGAWRPWSSGRSAAEVPTATAQKGDVEETVTATGTVQPRDYVDVGTQVSGQIKKLHVDIGQTVKKGELLAEIDPTVYLARVDADQAQLKNLQAQLAQNRANATLAGQKAKRQQALARDHATTDEAVQTAVADLASAKAQIQAIQAQIQQTESQLRGDQANLGYTKIYAPMDGTVVTLSAKEGQTLNANQQAPIILRIADLSTMTVQAQVSEADVPKLRLGMPVYFTTLGHQDKRWDAKLRQIYPTPEIVNNVVLYDALFDVPNPDGALMTQMTTQVFFVVGQAKDAVLVPLAAVQQGKRGAAVRVVAADGGVERRKVTLGVSDRVSVQIVSGLQAGERVVLASANSSRSGSGSNARTPRFGPHL